MFVRTFHSIHNYLRCKSFAHILLPYLQDYKSVLDVGTSTGALAASILESAPDLRLAGVDVVVGSQPFIPMVKGNGKRLPFEDNAFDCVMMIDVLHHDEHPGELLAEAKRVSRKRVLIKDHYWNSRFDHLVLSAQDYIGNKFYGIDLPYNFLQMNTWHTLFEDIGLNVVGDSNLRLNAFDLRKHVIFELEKPQTAIN